MILVITHADDTITVASYDKEENIPMILSKLEHAYLITKGLEVRVPFKSWKLMEDDKVIKDREFRNAWRADGDSVKIDINHAKEIHKHRLRYFRKPLLEALDIEYQKADETQDSAKKAEIAAKKRALRDITKHPLIEGAETIEDLKKVKLDGN